MSKIILFRRLRALDIGAFLVVIITFMLFALSLFLKGITHDMLLETGVFLVSVKLILLSHESKIMNKSMDAKLNDINNVLIKCDNCNGNGTEVGSEAIDKVERQI
ncbi:MAG: hypothetical protein P4L43_00785 [Syntrophobacteraceae bacterium]|nr:hypothetical protein [Syntrophobacteraceae bacterium]